MREFFSITTFAAMLAACSAPTPIRSTDSAADDAERTDHDSPPMDDAVCLSGEQFDALADFECPALEAAACPNVAVTCENAPVTVACECPVACPSVEVTCETPEPEACEPEIVEVAVQPPSFRVIGLPIAGDPSEMPAVILLGVEFFGGDVDARMTTLTFSAWKYGSVEWYPRGYFEGTDFCALVDCATLQLWQYREDDDRWELLSSALQSITSIAVGTPEDWEGHLLPANDQQRVLLLGNVRADAPPGRYHIALNDFLVAGDDGEVIIPGTPAYGSDFTVVEDMAESETCERETPDTGDEHPALACNIAPVLYSSAVGRYRTTIENPRDPQSLLSISFFGACTEHAIDWMEIQLVRVGTWFETVPICSVFVCDADGNGSYLEDHRLQRSDDIIIGFDGPGSLLETDGSAFGGDPFLKFDSPEDEYDHRTLTIPTNDWLNLELIGRIRDDAPAGSYDFDLRLVEVLTSDRTERITFARHHFGPSIVVSE